MHATQTNAAPVEADVQDIELSDAAFVRLRQLVRQHTGIALNETKRELVFGRLRRRLRALNLSSFEEYIAVVERGESLELQEFTNSITTNLTSFFREPYHFDFLLTDALPQLAQRARASKRLRLWCCAASTGEEPWSISMVLHENPSLLAGYDVKLLATDIDTSVLATAEAGVYPLERVKGIPSARVSRWFQRGTGEQQGMVRIRPELRERVSFKPLNLMNSFPMHGPFDVIFCRNVIIYFDKETQAALFARMAELQRPGDYLFLGHSETLSRVSDRYELVGRTIYRRIK